MPGLLFLLTAFGCSTLPDTTSDAFDALSPRPSVDSAVPAPLGFGNRSSSTSTDNNAHRGSSVSGATDDAIKALEDALAIPEEEADVATLSIKDEALASNEDVSAKDAMTKVDSSSASTAVVDDKSSFVAPSTAPTEKDEAAQSAPAKDSNPGEPADHETEDNDNTPKASMDISREKGFDATSSNNNDQECDKVKEEEDSDKKGKETSATTTGDEQQAATTVEGDENPTVAPAS